ncbi:MULTISPECIES: transposase [unclassified Vibrio]|uniref:Transposase n=1 Tax=Vibrio sp. HB236076 TaxID=3232307 RepID=A0AB39HIW6_9VIBR|nr:transposase [Vibrio sp. HB161653]MDP5255091.1 transposase [Vibrio sp. HB161653]
MTTPRKQQICLEATPYYHCMSRCVRRSYLCGQDPLTGKSYEHRKGWIEERIHALAAIYCIDILAYAVMSNHYHLVVRIDKHSAEQLTDWEVVERWSQLHSLPLLIEKWRLHLLDDQSETLLCQQIIDTWRQRLCDLSWFIKELNHSVSIQANREDQCSGRFWEGRYKSQALLDEKALLTAMAYVDLNPVRANVANTPEKSNFTSIKRRLTSIKKPSIVSRLALFSDSNDDGAIPFQFTEYLVLLDWLGRQVREDKKGHIPQDLPPILARLNLSPEQCCHLCLSLGHQPRLWIGVKQSIERAKTILNKLRMRGFVIESAV